jgi:transmembrane sensor
LRAEGRTRVTVFDGEIGIYAATGDAPDSNGLMEVRPAQAQLYPGQQAELSEKSGRILNRATLSADELSRMLAWREGLLEFYETPLQDALKEFNRYHPEQLAIADSSLGERKVSGSFQPGMEEGFVQALEAEFNLRLEEPRIDNTPTITLYSGPAKRRSITAP